MGECGYLSFSNDYFKIYDVSPQNFKEGVKLPENASPWEFERKAKKGLKEKPEVSVFLPKYADQGFRNLRTQDYIDYTGNNAQSAELIYYQGILFIQLKAKAPLGEVHDAAGDGKGAQSPKEKPDVGILASEEGDAP
jgi:hypothetical protein